MYNMPNKNEIRNVLPPDIVQLILPYLSPKDIKSLSLTNRYFNELLDYGSSNILWSELFRKSFESTHTDEEPFISTESNGYKTCAETILLNNYEELDWNKFYNLRKYRTGVYTWGCLKNGRLGFTIGSNNRIPNDAINELGVRMKLGINRPLEVPWLLHSIPISGRANSWFNDDEAGENRSEFFSEYNRSIVQLSAGGFSFQILTQSGKLYSTGATYHGGHNGPGPINGEHDFQPIDEAIRALERSFPHVTRSRTTGSMGDPVRVANPYHTTNLTGTFDQPHEDIYARIMELNNVSSKTLPGNDQVRQMFPRCLFDIEDPADFQNAVDNIKFIAVSSGRSHFLALDENNNIYSWDGRQVSHGIKLKFDGLPPQSSNPILKIGCGWNCNCAYIYGVGLVVWKSRDALIRDSETVNAHYHVIPGTGDVNGENKIIDFACCSDNAVFYITNEGRKLWLYSNDIEKYLDLKIPGKIVKIQASNRTLAIFTDKSCYTADIVQGEVNYDSLTEIETNEGVKFISLSFGDYHTVALSNKGTIFTWGLESESCGCLGLGSPSTVQSQGTGVFENSRSIRVRKPAEVKTDGVCVAVTAGGWQTGAIIIKTGGITCQT